VVLKKIKSVIAVPVLIAGKTSGLLYFHTSKPERPFRADDLELASTIAMGPAGAYARMKRQLNLAAHATAADLGGEGADHRVHVLGLQRGSGPDQAEVDRGRVAQHRLVGGVEHEDTDTQSVQGVLGHPPRRRGRGLGRPAVPTDCHCPLHVAKGRRHVNRMTVASGAKRQVVA